MRLYKTVATRQDVQLEGEDIQTRWSGSQADAAGDRRWFNSTKKIPRDNITTHEVDVPTDKKGLLGFLNDQEKGR